MTTPDFDATVFLAALAVGPILTLFVFYGWLLHREEMQTGQEPKWLWKYILCTQVFAWPVIFLMYKSWFFWNLGSIFIGVFMTSIGTFLAARWLYSRQSGRKQRQHRGPEG